MAAREDLVNKKVIQKQINRIATLEHTNLLLESNLEIALDEKKELEKAIAELKKEEPKEEA